MADRFRRKKEPKHIRLYATITGSEAWKHLSGNAIKVLLALVARDDGTRNGAISFSCREAADVTGLGERTSWRCLIELQEFGFIQCTQRGAFSRKISHASQWRYTWAPWPGGRPAAPTRDFETWRCMETRGCKICSRAVAVSDEPSGNNDAAVANSATGKLETPDVSATPHPAKCATLILYQGDRFTGPETDQQKQVNFLIGSDFGGLAVLRNRLAEHLQASPSGEQSRLAERLSIPPGTLSKFRSGRNLPDAYRAPLADAIATSFTGTTP